MSRPALALLLAATLLLLSGCDTLRGLTGNVSVGGAGSPVVRAGSGGSAVLQIIVCPRTVEGGALVGQLIEQMVAYTSAIVVAENAAQARMIVNACPFPPEASLAARTPRPSRGMPTP